MIKQYACKNTKDTRQRAREEHNITFARKRERLSGLHPALKANLPISARA